MKKIISSICLLVIGITICLLFVSSSAVNAQKSTSFVYDKNKETVFLYDSVSCVLTPRFRYEYSYSEDGQTTNKKTFCWDASTEQWIPCTFFAMTVIGENQVHEFARWDKQKMSFSRDRQKAVYYKEAGTDASNYISFRWNEKSSKWEVRDGERFENYIALLVNNSSKLK